MRTSNAMSECAYVPPYRPALTVIRRAYPGNPLAGRHGERVQPGLLPKPVEFDGFKPGLCRLSHRPRNSSVSRLRIQFFDHVVRLVAAVARDVGQGKVFVLEIGGVDADVQPLACRVSCTFSFGMAAPPFSF